MILYLAIALGAALASSIVAHPVIRDCAFRKHAGAYIEEFLAVALVVTTVLDDIFISSVAISHFALILARSNNPTKGNTERFRVCRGVDNI